MLFFSVFLGFFMGFPGLSLGFPAAFPLQIRCLQEDGQRFWFPGEVPVDFVPGCPVGKRLFFVSVGVRSWVRCFFVNSLVLFVYLFVFFDFCLFGLVWFWLLVWLPLTQCVCRRSKDLPLEFQRHQAASPRVQRQQNKWWLKVEQRGEPKTLGRGLQKEIVIKRK